jgi:Neurotransmitter-gated ion-channel ligand binding domain
MLGCSSAAAAEATSESERETSDCRGAPAMQLWGMLVWGLWGLLAPLVLANPDAKRLYDDLLSNYNRLIRPVSNNTDTVLVKLGLRLSQLIDLVSPPHYSQ